MPYITVRAPKIISILTFQGVVTMTIIIFVLTGQIEINERGGRYYQKSNRGRIDDFISRSNTPPGFVNGGTPLKRSPFNLP